MIPDDIRNARFERLYEAMDAAGIDIAAFVPGPNFYYLTGAHFHLMERPTVLFVARDGRKSAVIPVLEKDRWQALAPDVDTEYWQDSDGYEAAFEAAGRRMPGARLGVEGQRMRVFESNVLRATFRNAAILDTHAAVSAMRLRKDAAEIEAMQRAIDISERALAATIAWIRVGMSEAEIKSRLLQTMLEEGADGPAFDAIVLSGGASADPHGTASAERTVSAGDPLLFDFGAAWGGYNADITRTFFVGEPTARHRDVYEAVLAANTLGRDITRPGMTLHDLDEAVTDRLRQSGFGDMIVHKTGHGLGLDVHEAPQVMIGNSQQMEPGMVITIEPGLYAAGDIGVRIEDDVLVTEEGCRSLTGFDRTLTVIGD